ncbi:hypothetical protein R3P38DRAFT_1796538 [Favolaschia claudopus]|uniref:F-box domain-containing protein n=1 Tax=Favolaschia claudopus TaxID=2862362 RepID=A0AAW0A6F5_9AGAR
MAKGATQSAAAPRSPFSEYIGTNYIPTDTEIAQIGAHLVPYEMEVVQLEAQIQALSVQRDRLKSYIGSHKALISQPRRLPQDIVEEIFLDCLPTAHNAVMDAREAPLLLGRICSRWRLIALALPKLWASLHISVGFLTTDLHETAVLEWLKRAAPLPLYISAQYERTFFTEDSIVPLITQFSSRWAALHLYGSPGTDISLLAAVHDAPHLADIRIDLRSDQHLNHNQANDLFTARIFAAPLPQKIRVTLPQPSAIVPLVAPFTWDQITDLTLMSSTVTGSSDIVLSNTLACRLLEGCQNLKSLEIPVFPLDDVRQPPLVHPLETLIIHNHGTTFKLLEYFFQSFILPQLTKLHVTNLESHWDEDEPLPAHPLMRLGDRCPLVSDLRLDLIDGLGMISFVNRLEALPHIERLSLILKRDDYDMMPLNEAVFFKALTPTETSNRCPRLLDLYVQTEECREKVWKKFLQAHLDHSTSFRRLHLHLWSQDPYDSVDQLLLPDTSRFRDRGIDVFFEYELVNPPVEATPWDGIER